MHRPLGKFRLWIISDSSVRSKLINYGQRNVAGEIGFFRSVVTAVGDCLLGYGEESTTKSIQKKIADALFLGERGRASNMLLDFGQTNNLLTADDFVDILKCCAKLPDPLFAMETWRMMEEKEIHLNNFSCLLLIQALCKGGFLDEAFNLIVFTGEKHGVYPSLAVYNSFLGACSKMHDLIHANKCLDLMAHRMSGKNEVTYLQLLKLAVFQKNLSAVHEIWKDYTKLYSPSLLSLQKFIYSFTRLRDLNSAFETLQLMVSLALQGNTSISSTNEGRLYSSRLDIPIPYNTESGMPRFGLKETNGQFFHLKANVSTTNIEQSTIYNPGNEVERVRLDETKCLPAMKVLKSSFGDVIHACAKTRNSRLAEQLMLQMLNLGVQPSSHTYDRFVRAVMHKRGISEGLKMLETMQQRNLKPYSSTLATISVVFSKHLELDLAEGLLNQISNYQDPYPYNVFLEACDIMDKPECAVRMWAKIKRLQIQPDIRTYELLFSLFGNVNAPYEDGNMLSQVDCTKRINAIEMDMMRNGVQHSHLSMMNLLKALGAEGMIRELIHYLHKAEDLFCHSNTYIGKPIYKIVLHSLVEAKESKLAIESFKNIQSSGAWLDAAIYTTMIDCCSIIRCYRSASALVSLMIRDGFHPNTATYTALAKVLLEKGKFDEALNLLDQGSSEGIQPDALLYNTFIRKAFVKGRIDVIEFIVEQMHREKIKPNSVTCNYVFSTYLERGFYNTAMEALQVLSLWMISDEDNSFEEKKAEFEDDYVLSEDPGAESRILEYFGGPEENIAVALLNLRWCAIAAFPISWSPNETLWARRLSVEYDAARKRIGR